MFALIRGTGMFVGLFSTKERMKFVIDALIKDDYERTGAHGNYNYRYVEFNLDEPWFCRHDEYPAEVGKALFSLSTMNTEYFTHCVKTDWSTGEILDIDANDTTNLN